MKHRSKKLKTAIIQVLLLIAVVQAFFAVEARAETESDKDMIMEEQMQLDEVKTIENQLKKHAPKEFMEIMPEFDPYSILKDTASGNMKPDIPSLMKRILMYLFKEIYTNFHLLIKLIVIAVFCAILKNLQASFLSESVSELAFYACYIAIVSILVLSLDTAFKLGREIIDQMVVFMHSTIPVLVTLMVSGGNIATGGVLQPVLIVVVEIAASLFKNFFLPLIFFTAVLSIVDNISDKVQISKLSGFIKQINTWAMGIILTAFIAIVSLQGSLGAVIDGVTSKTAKFAIGAFVPVAGKYLADAADTVIGCTLLIKNAAGVAVMIGIIAVCTIPLLKLLAIIILYRITCVLIEPISEKRITNCINDMANSISHILGISAVVAVMFLISVTVIISASNISAMIR